MCMCRILPRSTITPILQIRKPRPREAKSFARTQRQAVAIGLVSGVAAQPCPVQAQAAGTCCQSFLWLLVKGLQPSHRGAQGEGAGLWEALLCLLFYISVWRQESIVQWASHSPWELAGHAHSQACRVGNHSTRPDRPPGSLGAHEFENRWHRG